MATSKMTFKAMYLVSEDYLKDIQSKGSPLESTPPTVPLAQTEPSFPPPPPPSTSQLPHVVQPPIPQSQTNPSNQNVEMVEEKDDLESWTPPNSEPHTLIASSSDGNRDNEVNTITSPSNNENEGGVDRAPTDLSKINTPLNKKTKVTSPPVTKSMEISNIRKKKSICTICNAEFDTKKELMEHIKTRHKGKKAFDCRICNKTFESESGLNKHIKQIHFSSQVWESKKRVNPMVKTLTEKRKRMENDDDRDVGGKPETSVKRTKEDVKSRDSKDLIKPMNPTDRTLPEKRKRMENDVRDVVGKLETAVKRSKVDVKSQDSENLIKCKECNKIFESFKDFKQHQLTAHSGQRKRKTLDDQLFDQNGRIIQPKKVNLK